MGAIWRKVWQFACREEHVAETGDFFVYDIGRQSVLIMRGEDGLKALHAQLEAGPSGSRVDSIDAREYPDPVASGFRNRASMSFTR